jgi:5-hydroxyisourate hydrolase-like protein (transthyretin family)
MQTFSKKSLIHCFRTIGIIIVLACLLSSCAIMGGGPTGGKKDVTPPKVKSETPANKSVHFTGKRISISFDEYIVLDNIFKEVIITPVLSKMPDISVSGKSVIINFKDIKLDTGTTYSIQFGSAIKDFHENNPLKNYRYIFSTGAYVDSGFITGHIVKALGGKPGAGFKVQLYKKGSDSSIFKKKPLYYTRSDSNGGFKVDYLPKGVFQLYALKDDNDNYTLDNDEYVGFPDHLITVDTFIRLKDSIYTFPFIDPHIIMKKAQLTNHSLQVKYNHAIDSFEVFDKGKRFFTSYEKSNEEKDSFTYWMSESFPELETKAVYQNQVLDSVLLFDKDAKTLPFRYNVNTSNDNSNYNWTPVLIKCNKPISIVNMGKVILKKDTATIKKASVVFLDSNHTTMKFVFDFEENTSYSLNILPGAFVSIFNEKMKDTVKNIFNTPGLRGYGNLEITIIGNDKNYIFQLVNESDQVVFYKYVSRETLVKIPFVNPGKYRVRVINDENKNGRWDGGDVIKRQQPEEVFYYPTPINIKANWELAGLKFDVTQLNKNIKKQ